MKKFISILLVLVMVLAMGTTAFAASSPSKSSSTSSTSSSSSSTPTSSDATSSNATYQEVSKAGTTEAYIESQSADVQAAVEDALEDQSLSKAPVTTSDLEVAAVKTVSTGTTSASKKVSVDLTVDGTKRTDAVVVVTTSSTGAKAVADAAISADGVVTATVAGDTKTAVVMTASRFSDDNKVATTKYTDIEANAWYADNMSWAVGNGLLEGKSSTTMAPSENVTFEQACTMFQRAAGNDSTTYAAAVSWASADGTSKGITKSGSASMSRAELVKMLYQFAGSPKTTGTASFKDASSISSDLKAAFAWAQAQGILKGFADGTVRPDELLTRAQLSAIIERYAK